MAVIDVHSFGFTYLGAAKPAVREVSFHVEPGEISDSLARATPARARRRTFWIRLLDGYQGSVAVLGKDLRAWDTSYYRRIGVAFEEHQTGHEEEGGALEVDGQDGRHPDASISARSLWHRQKERTDDDDQKRDPQSGSPLTTRRP